MTNPDNVGGLPTETNCPPHDEEIVVTSKNYEAGFLAGMKFCETHFHDGVLCRAAPAGGDAPQGRWELVLFGSRIDGPSGGSWAEIDGDIEGIIQRLCDTNGDDPDDYTVTAVYAKGWRGRAVDMPVAPAGSGEVSRLELAKMELAVTAALFNYEQGDTVSEWLKNTAALLRKLQQGAECFVREMRTSKGSEFFVVVRCNGRELTPHMYTERWKAEYDVASWQHLLCGAPEPDLLAYGPDAASQGQEGGHARD